eukprot:352800-Chlamydomonas_euryale.AAC.10
MERCTAALTAFETTNTLSHGSCSKAAVCTDATIAASFAALLCATAAPPPSSGSKIPRATNWLSTIISSEDSSAWVSPALAVSFVLVPPDAGVSES